MPTSRILLTGFMGSGKSTVGPLVADRLGYRFIDLDVRLAETVGRPVEVLFVEKGEGTFRAIETAVLSQVLEEDKVVIATGGGALASEATMAMAKDLGLVVFLDTSPEILAGRLELSINRPLLEDETGEILSGQALITRIDDLLKRRRRYYDQSHATINVTNLTPPDVAAEVVRITVSTD